MLLAGMHGGIYFNPKGGKPGIKYPRSKYPSGIPGVTINEYPKEWFEGVPRELYLSRRYSTSHNSYGVKSGLDQAGWESSGWINPCDPRGWTQWYFRFFLGRRLKGGEDERQMSRWSGVCGEKGRWKQNLIAKCARDGAAYDDVSVSPVVRQTLLHWAYELTHDDYKAGVKRVQKNGAAYVPREQLRGVSMRDNDKEDEREQTAATAAATAAASSAARQQRAQRRAAAEPSAHKRARGSAAPAAQDKEERAEEPLPSKKRRRSTERSVKVGMGLAEEEELSPYERERDERRARNEKELVRLGLS
jgi:hypothetical protein